MRGSQSGADVELFDFSLRTRFEPATDQEVLGIDASDVRAQRDHILGNTKSDAGSGASATRPGVPLVTKIRSPGIGRPRNPLVA